MNREIIQHSNSSTNGLYTAVCSIIEQSKGKTLKMLNQTIIATYWQIGKRIVEEEQHGKERAAYGNKLISELAERLTIKYGSGYGKRNLSYYRKLYLTFPEYEILHTRVQNLGWSHVRRILSVANADARLWYLYAANTNMWSVRELDRNISTQYCERYLSAGVNPKLIPNENHDSSPLSHLKNPVIAEFLGFRHGGNISESSLEQALIDNLEKFIMELGRGFAFVDRQKHIVTDTSDFFIDLVFYNYKMKCFVLFELKTHTLSHQDIGQLDMYVRMYDDLIKGEDDAPTIGVLLCTDTDSTIARYSVLNDSNNLYAAKYMTYLPSEEELRQEIEQQREYFFSIHPNKLSED